MAFHKEEFKEAIDYSQIAYLTFLEPGYMALYNGDKNYPTLESIIEACMGSLDCYNAYRKAVEDFNFRNQDVLEITIKDIVKYSSNISDADKDRLAELEPEIFSYRIQDVYNVKDYNGFFACYIDKGNGEKAIGIRGCENIRNKENFIHDWGDSSLGLVHSEETPQQSEVRYFLRYLKDSHQLDDCDKLTIAGHSLGGNLASHAAIVLEEDEFSDVKGKLYKAFNLDGPGVSQKYLRHNKEEIEKVATKDVIQHVRWSVVGNLLFDIPGTCSKNIKVNDRKLDKYIGEKDDTALGQLKRMFCKHSTVCVTPIYDMNEGWDVEEEKKDGLSKFLGTFSKSVDAFIPEPITYAAGSISLWLAEKILVRSDTKKDITEDIISRPSTEPIQNDILTGEIEL